MEHKFNKLRDPFPGGLVKWMIAQVEGARAFVVPFVPAPHYKTRLDSLFPNSWGKKIETLDSEAVRCLLQIDGVIHRGIARPNEEDGLNKSFDADKAFIRACQQFGLGQYLQYLTGRWVKYDPTEQKVTSPAPILPAWALPGGAGYPVNVPGKPRSAAKAGAKSVQNAAHSMQQATPTAKDSTAPEKQGVNEIANEQALRAWEELVCQAKKAGVPDIQSVVPPITVGDLRKRYRELKDLVFNYHKQRRSNE